MAPAATVALLTKDEHCTLNATVYGAKFQAFSKDLCAKNNFCGGCNVKCNSFQLEISVTTKPHSPYVMSKIFQAGERKQYWSKIFLDLCLLSMRSDKLVCFHVDTAWRNKLHSINRIFFQNSPFLKHGVVLVTVRCLILGLLTQGLIIAGSSYFQLSWMSPYNDTLLPQGSFIDNTALYTSSFEEKLSCRNFSS